MPKQRSNGDIQIRCRTLLIQICESEDVEILKGVISKDHVHIHLDYGPSVFPRVTAS